MHGYRPALIMCVLGASVSAAIVPVLTAAQTPLEVKIGEANLRNLAMKTTTPSFPEPRLVDNKTGVVVVFVVVEGGKVLQAKFLEAPAPALGQAAEAAVKQWTFRPTTLAGRSVRVRSRLTFYYVIERGHGMFRDPGEMPTKK